MSTPVQLLPRATETDSNGCVVCTGQASCPTCPSGEQCVLTIQTCAKCPETYCKATTTSTASKSHTSIGGIVGGVIGGVAVLVAALCAFYFLYYKRKVAFSRVRHKEFYFDDDVEINFHRPPQELDQPAQRQSLATTMFTRASNIIPIAYIPGVTIAKSSRESTVTVDSDLAGHRYSRASIVGNPAHTTTAIRATPRLVSVNDKRGSVVVVSGVDDVPSTAVNAQQLGGVKSVRVERSKPFMAQDDLIEEDDEEDDDGDDASVVMKDEGTVLSTADYDPFILDDDQASVKTGDSRQSMLLDVEMERRSPFEE